MTITFRLSAIRPFIALTACSLFFFAAAHIFAQQSLSPSGSNTKKINSKKKLPIKKKNVPLKKNSAKRAETEGGATISSMKRVKPTSSDRDLRSLPQVGPTEAEKNQEQEEVEQELPFVKNKKPLPGVIEPTYIRPEQPLNVLSPNPIQSFDGLDNANWGLVGGPPDTVGDVGPNHYIQAVNTSIGIFNKTGTRLAAFTFNNFWSGQGAGTACGNTHKGDPTVVYDPQNNRWIVADFAYVNRSAPPYYECIAVSKTGDPVAGGWWYYAIRADDAAHPWFPDYPKMGIWSDGLYMTANMFSFGSTSSNPKEVRIFAFRLSDLIGGAPVANVVIDTIGDSSFPLSLLPANYRGTPPPAGRDAIIIGETFFEDGFHVYKFHPDFGVPANSTYSGATIVSQAAYDFNFASSVPSSGNNLDTVSDRLLMQAQYRNINGVESLWVQHNVGQIGGGPVGIQWAQINVTGGTTVTTPVQQQIYNNLSGDGLHRWMSSLAVDRQGNMALGYSASNTGVNPSIRYNGRLSTDPPNTLPQGEVVIQAGGGSQSGNCPGTSTPCTRWGDYSSMTVDPTDDCTFWYTTEYYSVSGLNWQTRIASFRFPGCAVSRNLTVTKAADTNDGVCDADCSLREALAVAGSDNAPDIVTFNIPANSAGCVGTNCTISLTTPFTPAADAGEQTLIDGGAGANAITLSGGGSVAQIFNLGNAVNLSANSLNLTGTNGNNGNAAVTIASGGTMTLTNSALYGNSNSSLGGALKCDSGCVLNLTNVTISGNSSSNGGGIYNSGSVTATNCTITGNTGGFGGGGVAGGMTVRNTIIAGNSSVFSNLQDVSGGFNSQGYNLIGKTDGTNGFTATGDQTGTVASPLNARLAPLGNYGGKTLTHALLGSGATPSTAINTGTTTGAPATDARGALRIGAVDIGAFEVNNTANGGTFVAILPSGRQNSGYQTQIAANNGAFSYSVSGGALPNGISLTTTFAPAAVVAISGTPTQSGIFNFAITTSDGINSNVTNYSLIVLAPSAASVSVSGRVLTANGLGVRNAIATITDPNGNARSVRTGSFGYFRFEDIQAGETYIIAVTSKRYQFTPRAIAVADELTDVDFIGQ